MKKVLSFVLICLLGLVSVANAEIFIDSFDDSIFSQDNWTFKDYVSKIDGSLTIEDLSPTASFGTMNIIAPEKDQVAGRSVVGIVGSPIGSAVFVEDTTIMKGAVVWEQNELTNRLIHGIFLRGNLADNTVYLLNMDPGSSGGGNTFSIRMIPVGGPSVPLVKVDQPGIAYVVDKTYYFEFGVDKDELWAVLWDKDYKNPLARIYAKNSDYAPGASDGNIFIGFQAAVLGGEEINVKYEVNRLSPEEPIAPKILRAAAQSSDTFNVSSEVSFDCNQNGVEDALDCLNGTSEDCNGNNVPDECEDISMRTDLDGDGDVDGQDFLTFSCCYNSSSRPPRTSCENACADFDKDGDVDGNDFLTFSLCYNGSLRPPNCN